MELDNLINDFIERLKASGANWKEGDGYVQFRTRPRDNEHPWVYVKHDMRQQCTMWKLVIYDFFCKQFMKGEGLFIPLGCIDCFKVVVRPRTYQQLLGLKDLMFELDLPGKVGCEVRRTVKGLYGGYFYCRGLEEGLERLEQIKEKINSGIPVYLKRGCTEFEIDHGPSDKWQITDKQLELETAIQKRIVIDPYQHLQTQEDVDRVYELWEKFAWKLDPTFNGKEMFPKCVTYGGG